MQSFRRTPIRRIVLAALFCATICIATMIAIPIPGTQGYVHPGDALCLLAAFILPFGDAVIAAGLGSALADLLGGFAVYVPATFVIKAVLAASAYLIMHLFSNDNKKRSPLVGSVLAGVTGELCMIIGYFLYESVLYSVPSAAIGIPANGAQALFGLFSAVLLYRALQGKLNIQR